MIKVAHIVNSLEPGGMENGVVNVVRGLAGKDFQFEVWCLERPGEFAGRLPESVPVRILGKRTAFTPGAVATLRGVARRFGPDVVHTHNLGPLIYAGLSHSGFPILHGEHAQLNEDELRLRPLMLRRMFLRVADMVHTVSRSLTVDLLRTQQSLHRVVSIVNGVDTAKFSPGRKNVARTNAAFRPDALILGMVGRFGPYKRHDLMLAAFQKLALIDDRLELLLVGAGGSEESMIRKTAEATSLRGRIHFAGLQSNLCPWYRMMDLLVVPSVNEGLSNAVLESMACGVPALCHLACGNSEVISHGEDGWLMDINTVERLTGSLKGVLGDPEHLCRAGLMARNKVIHRFSMETMLDHYAEAYRTLARRGERSVPRLS